MLCSSQQSTPSPAGENGSVCAGSQRFSTLGRRDGDRLGERGLGVGRVTLCSPPLVAHAPRLAHAALLPHFDHACEGLHTRLPLGDQCDFSLHAHIGPGRKKSNDKRKKITQGVRNAESSCYTCVCRRLQSDSLAWLSAALSCVRWCNLS